MIFMHKETGELYELLVVSLEEVGLVSTFDKRSAYGIGDFALYGLADPRQLASQEFSDYFECLGFL
jgi:hypothetical protein